MATKVFWDIADIWNWKFKQSQYFENIFKNATVKKLIEIYCF